MLACQAWECHGTLQSELANVAREKEVWGPLRYEVAVCEDGRWMHGCVDIRMDVRMDGYQYNLT